jgi:hypothetical protein
VRFDFSDFYRFLLNFGFVKSFSSKDYSKIAAKLIAPAFSLPARASRFRPARAFDSDNFCRDRLPASTTYFRAQTLSPDKFLPTETASGDDTSNSFCIFPSGASLRF